MNKKDIKPSTSNKRIKELLSELGVSQIEFCNKTGIKPSALSNYLNNNRVPRQDAISRIADAYNINPTWIMGYDVPKQYDIATLMHFSEEDENKKDHIEYYGQKDRVMLYAILIKIADRCTPEQIKQIIEMLKLYANANKD